MHYKIYYLNRWYNLTISDEESGSHKYISCLT